jgi:hypothetical protein
MSHVISKIKSPQTWRDASSRWRKSHLISSTVSPNRLNKSITISMRRSRSKILICWRPWYSLLKARIRPPRSRLMCRKFLKGDFRIDTPNTSCSHTIKIDHEATHHSLSLVLQYLILHLLLRVVKESSNTSFSNALSISIEIELKIMRRSRCKMIKL